MTSSFPHENVTPLYRSTETKPTIAPEELTSIVEKTVKSVLANTLNNNPTEPQEIKKEQTPMTTEEIKLPKWFPYVLSIILGTIPICLTIAIFVVNIGFGSFERELKASDAKADSRITSLESKIDRINEKLDYQNQINDLKIKYGISEELLKKKTVAMIQPQYDIITAGGGTSGFAAAVSAAREGASVLVIESMGHFGGAATSTYVTPMMKTILPNGTNLSGGLYTEVLARMKDKGWAEIFPDGNPGWFAPEMMKFMLDEVAEEAGLNILFHTNVIGTETKGKQITSVKVHNVSGISNITAKYFIDATTDSTLAAFAGVPFEVGLDGKNQAMSHRFVMTGVDIVQFSDWLIKKDRNKDVSPVYKTLDGDILLTTAYTAEDKGWALKDLFDDAIRKGIIKPEDADYFQLFTVPGQKGSVFFNCPRIYTTKPLSPLSAEDITYAQLMGRKQILRLADFCKHYLKGFEDSYISNIAPIIGVRDSRRIKGKYTLTVQDIVTARKSPNAVAKSNYPVDVHSSGYKGDDIKLKDNDYYEIPLECLQTNEYDNLLVVGKNISAQFYAQSSLRIQPTCWSMGEYAGKYLAKMLKN